MAALTLGLDGATLAHLGLFSLNGGCGYVLRLPQRVVFSLLSQRKPPFLRAGAASQAATAAKPLYLEAFHGVATKSA